MLKTIKITIINYRENTTFQMIAIDDDCVCMCVFVLYAYAPTKFKIEIKNTYIVISTFR